MVRTKDLLDLTHRDGKTIEPHTWVDSMIVLRKCCCASLLSGFNLTFSTGSRETYPLKLLTREQSFWEVVGSCHAANRQVRRGNECLANHKSWRKSQVIRE